MEKTVLQRFERQEADRLSSHRGSCDQCRFCGIKSDGVRPGITFICRYDPPKTEAMLAMTPQGAQWQVACIWPEVQKDDWCGKFEATIN